MNLGRQFEVTLQRKGCLNENQTARMKRATVTAHDEALARAAVLRRAENAAFVVINIREVPL